jgi:NADH-quinone oxidoreductase subunit A
VSISDHALAAQIRARIDALLHASVYSLLGPSYGKELLVADFRAVLIFFIFIVGFGVVSLAMARVLRPARPDLVKLTNYECGAEPIGPAWIQFPVGFYLVAIVFIVFDALAVFLFPWAMVLRTIGMPAFWVMAVFVGIILLGWLYAYREGVLEWK